jgi:hypothetical protein
MELLTTCQTCRRARPREHLNSLADCDLALRARLWVGLSALHFGAPSLRCGVPCASRSAGRLRSLRNGADTRHSINRPRRSACGGLPPLRCDARRLRGAPTAPPTALQPTGLVRYRWSTGRLVPGRCESPQIGGCWLSTVRDRLAIVVRRDRFKGGGMAAVLLKLLSLCVRRGALPHALDVQRL